MAKQAPLRNRGALALALLLMLFNCRPQTSPAIPAVFVVADQPGWQHRDGRLWWHDTLFSGWQYQLWAPGDTAFVGGFSEGRAEGFHRHWYSGHRPKEIRHFQRGWQEGEQRGWFDSGKPAFVYQFGNDVYDGVRKEWYPNGQPALDGHYQHGQENGWQRQWFANGVLKVNYVARHGRNYGFTGVKNCVNVWDSVTVSH